MLEHCARLRWFLTAGIVIGLFISACASEVNSTTSPIPSSPTSAPTSTPPGDTPNGGGAPNPGANQQNAGPTQGVVQQTGDGGPVTDTPAITFIRSTEIAEGLLASVGVGRDIDGQANPTLRVKTNDVVQVTLINGDGAEHDVSFPNFRSTSNRVVSQERAA